MGKKQEIKFQLTPCMNLQTICFCCFCCFSRRLKTNTKTFAYKVISFLSVLLRLIITVTFFTFNPTLAIANNAPSANETEHQVWIGGTHAC